MATEGAERSDGDAGGDEAEVPPEIEEPATPIGGHAAPPSPEATEYYRQQTQFVHLQFEHLAEQRGLIMAHLRMRRVSERLASASQIAIALASTVAIVFFAIMVNDALNSKAIIVEPFETPSALSDDGITGKEVAGALLDVLTTLDAKTESTLEHRTFSNSWSDDIKVDLPGSGISVSEINRLLRARFGHDVHWTGNLVRTDVHDLALTVRGDGVLPKTFEGKAAELQKLVIQAGEYLYGQSQPVLYASYLEKFGRYNEELAFSEAELPTATILDRPYLLNSAATAIVNEGGSATQALRTYEAAISLKPNFWDARSKAINTLRFLGDEQGAWLAGQFMERAAGGRPGRAPEFFFRISDALTWNLQAWRNETVADLDAKSQIGVGPAAAGPVIADIDWRLHDNYDAELQPKSRPGDPTIPSNAGLSHFVRGQLAAATGDVARAVAEMEAFGATFADPAFSRNYPGYDCWIAPAEEAVGNPAKAEAALKQGGRFVDCYRFRADSLDRRGRWPEAQLAYADAVLLAPDLPAAYYSWGLALARHENFEGATEKLAAANRRGPHWADPLKAWGDVLARLGRWGQALMKYNEALTYAPNWGALKEARKAAQRKA